MVLCQGRYFLVRDVTKKMDTLGTLESCGALNFRQVRGGLPVFGMGQPSLLGFRRVLQKLQKDGFKVSFPRRLALHGVSGDSKALGWFTLGWGRGVCPGLSFRTETAECVVHCFVGRYTRSEASGLPHS